MIYSESFHYSILLDKIIKQVIHQDTTDNHSYHLPVPLFC